MKPIKNQPNFFKVTRPNAIEDLAVALNDQLAEVVAENIKLNSQLRVISNNYNDIVKEYLEMSEELESLKNKSKKK
jgi:predicted nuclease with TOPRIM domain